MKKKIVICDDYQVIEWVGKAEILSGPNLM